MAKLTEILSTLQQPIPPQALSSKTIKGKKILYIAWYDLTDLLDEKAGLGNWEWQVKDVQQIGDRLTLTGCLTIHGIDRSLTMSATGSESINCSDYGDPSSNSEAMALRRAAAKFGLGREMWRKDRGWRNPENPSSYKPQNSTLSSSDKKIQTRRKLISLLCTTIGTTDLIAEAILTEKNKEIKSSGEMENWIKTSGNAYYKENEERFLAQLSN